MSNFEVEIRTTPIAPIGGWTYGTVILRQWTDETFDPLLLQHNRLNLQLGAQPYFYLLQGSAAAIAGGLAIQMACLIAGAAPLDAALGGELFFPMSVLESALGPVPTHSQVAGQSAVYNIRFYAAGHYTMNFQRDAHGAKIVHLDVEEI